MKRLAAAAAVLCIPSACGRFSQHAPQAQCQDAGVQGQVIGSIAQRMDAVFALQDRITEPEQKGRGRGYLAANPLKLLAIVEKSRGADGALQCAASLQANLAGRPGQEAFEQGVAATAYQVRELAPLDAKFKEMSDTLEAATRLKPVAAGSGLAAWDIDYAVKPAAAGKPSSATAAQAGEIGSYLAYFAFNSEPARPKPAGAPAAAAPEDLAGSAPAAAGTQMP